jgi:hypothetical protein
LQPTILGDTSPYCYTHGLTFDHQVQGMNEPARRETH